MTYSKKQSKQYFVNCNKKHIWDFKNKLSLFVQKSYSLSFLLCQLIKLLANLSATHHHSLSVIPQWQKEWSSWCKSQSLQQKVKWKINFPSYCQHYKIFLQFSMCFISTNLSLKILCTLLHLITHYSIMSVDRRRCICKVLHQIKFLLQFCCTKYFFRWHWLSQISGDSYN